MMKTRATGECVLFLPFAHSFFVFVALTTRSINKIPRAVIFPRVFFPFFFLIYGGSKVVDAAGHLTQYWNCSAFWPLRNTGRFGINWGSRVRWDERAMTSSFFAWNCARMSLRSDANCVRVIILAVLVCNWREFCLFAYAMNSPANIP